MRKTDLSISTSFAEAWPLHYLARLLWKVTFQLSIGRRIIAGFIYLISRWKARYVNKLTQIPPIQYTTTLQQMYQTLYQNDDYACLRPHNYTTLPTLRGCKKKSLASMMTTTQRQMLGHLVGSTVILRYNPVISLPHMFWHDAVTKLSQGLSTIRLD